MKYKDTRTYTPAQIAELASHVHGIEFNTNRVHSFLAGEAGTIGDLGAGPKGARLIRETEAIGIAALLPWTPCLGGEEKRAEWVAQVRQALLARAPGEADQVWLQIRPGFQPGDRNTILTKKNPPRPGKMYPAVLLIDLQRIRAWVIEQAKKPVAPWADGE